MERSSPLLRDWRHHPILLSEEAEYSTRGIDQVAAITELRTNTNDLLRFANETDAGILIARNNEPQSILVGLDQYRDFMAYQERRENASAAQEG